MWTTVLVCRSCGYFLSALSLLCGRQIIRELPGVRADCMGFATQSVVEVEELYMRLDGVISNRPVNLVRLREVAEEKE